MSILLTDLHHPLPEVAPSDRKWISKLARNLERAYVEGVWRVVLLRWIDGVGVSGEGLAASASRAAREMERLRSSFGHVGGLPTLVTGSGFRLGSPREAESVGRLHGVGVGGTRWILVRMDEDQSRPERSTEIVRTLRASGLQVLIARPEAHPLPVGADPLGILRRWRHAGAAFQVDAASLEGLYGRAAAAQAWRMIEAHLVDVVASGSTAGGGPQLVRAAARRLAFRRGPEEALLLTSDNPRRILENAHRLDLGSRVPRGIPALPGLTVPVGERVDLPGEVLPTAS